MCMYLDMYECINYLPQQTQSALLAFEGHRQRARRGPGRGVPWAISLRFLPVNRVPVLKELRFDYSHPAVDRIWIT